MEHTPAQPPQTAEQAYEQQYEVLSRVMARVINKITNLHDSNSEKNWAHVGDLEHVTEIMNDLDEFLGN